MVGEELPEMERMCEVDIRETVVSEEIVKKKLEGLNQYKSNGSDNLHPYVLRANAPAISSPLSMIFKESLNAGETPEDWRK